MDLSRLPRLESRLGLWGPHRVQELDRKGREEIPKKLCVLCGYGFLSAQASPSAPAAVSIIFSTFQFSRLITSTVPSGSRSRVLHRGQAFLLPPQFDWHLNAPSKRKSTRQQLLLWDIHRRELQRHVYAD